MKTGFLNIDKDEGVSSAYVVNRVKRLTRTACGHLGTLDPLACGVLPVGVGNATRLFDYFLDKTKRYSARFRFGVTTDTLDREGQPHGEGRIPSGQEIAAALPRFQGEIGQIPPLYSAKSVNGRRGYELARAGETFTLPPKRVRVDEFRLLGQTGEDEFAFEIVCGGGTYIRSLARDLAEACGTVGYMSYLCRTQSGAFTLQNAVKLSELTEKNWESYLIPTPSVLPFPVLESPDPRIFHGVRCPTDAADGEYLVYCDGEFYGTACVSAGTVKIGKKLC